MNQRPSIHLGSDLKEVLTHRGYTRIEMHTKRMNHDSKQHNQSDCIPDPSSTTLELLLFHGAIATAREYKMSKQMVLDRAQSLFSGRTNKVRLQDLQN